jgi:hypothetical protein
LAREGSWREGFWRRVWSLWAIALGPSLLVAPRLLPAPIAVPACFVTFAWLPGLLATRLLRPDLRGGERWLSALALSPALAGGLAAIGWALGLRSEWVQLGVVFVVVVMTTTFWNHPRSSDDAVTDEWGPPASLIPALVWAAIVAVFLIGNPYLPLRSDGWFHAAVTEQIAARGLPVEDPAFAGLRLLYFWGPHAWAALWLASGSTLSAWTPWVALNLSAAAAAILAVGALARRLGASRGVQALAAACAVLGAAPFAWGWVAARAASGDVRGFAEIQRLVLTGADGALRSVGVGLLHPSLATFADKFLVLTPFGMGLALFCLFVTALGDVDRSPSRARYAWLGLVTAAALFTHTVAGLCALAVGGVWCAWRARGGLRAVVAPALAIGAGLVVTLPYLIAVAGGKRGALGSGLSPLAISSLVLGGALLIPAAVYGLAARATRAVREVALAAVVLAALGLLVKLPESNQSKFMSLLFVLLAAPAAVGIAKAWRERPRLRAPLALGLAAASLPTAALVAAGFWAERGRTPDSWHQPSTAVVAGWDWLRRHTPADAIVADEGGTREAMVFAARTGLAPGASLERDWGHARGSLAARRLASRELCARGLVSASTDSLMRALHRPIVVVERSAEAPPDPHLARADEAAAAPPAQPRHEVRYRLLEDYGPLRFWSAEVVR